MATFAFFLDAGLTNPLSGPLPFAQMADGSTGPDDAVVYLGSSINGKLLRNLTNPGVAQLVLSVADASPGAGHPATEVKLSLTEAGLAGATGGASLNLGTSVSGGTANALPIWIRVTDSTGISGRSIELSVSIADPQET